MIAVRLNEVSPDGASTRITYGLLNLAHRDSRENPQLLKPGEKYLVGFSLNHIAHRFSPGYRLRLAISTNYWPVAWPLPEPVTLTVLPDECRIELPVRRPQKGDTRLRAFPPPESAASYETGLAEQIPVNFQRKICRDTVTGEVVYSTHYGIDTSGQPVLHPIPPLRLETGHRISECFRIREDDSASASAEITHQVKFLRNHRSIGLETHLVCTATPDQFQLRAELTAYLDDQCILHKHRRCTVPRVWV